MSDILDIVDVESKSCTECGAAKPLIDFPIRRDQADGHHWWCFDCKRAHDREYSRKYRTNGVEKKRRSGRRYARKAEVRSRLNEAHLKTRYGLTREAFEAKLAAQGGKCPLCPEDAPETREWVVDHDHACCPGPNTCGECLRDILCRQHNMGLGAWADDAAALRAAAEYVERWSNKIASAGATPWTRQSAPSGPSHYAWQGDAASRDAIQQRIRQTLGSATQCESGCTGARRCEWFCTDETRLTDPATYVSLCHGCATRRRGQIGESHANAKLTQQQVDEIRARYTRGQPPTQGDLAREYRVSQATVSLIIRGKTYLNP